MLVEHREQALVLSRTRAAIERAGLSDVEAEWLLDLPAGSWSGPLASGGYHLGVEQERRARLLTELIAAIASDRAEPHQVRAWFLQRSEFLDGYSPLGWITADVTHLYALVVAIRTEPH